MSFELKQGENKILRKKLIIIWSAIKQRCFNERCKNYKKYGLLGITMCDEWYVFDNFFNWSISNGYMYKPDEKGRNTITIDRIDPKGNYEPKNCRWVSYEVQNTHLSKLKNNRSGYTGIFLLKSGNWLANISVNNKTISIGTFKTQKEALERRNRYIIENNLPNYLQEYQGEKVIVKKSESNFQKVKKSNPKNMVGKKFNRLFVIKEIKDEKSKYYKYDKWLCVCDCGKSVVIRGSALRTGRTKSCGCYRVEKLIDRRNQK